jgi:hypothetical protein
MTRNHAITTNTSDGQTVAFHHFKNEPIHVIVKEFFVYLKQVFIAKGEKISIFEDISDIPLSK